MGNVVSLVNLGKHIINMCDWVHTGNNNSKEIQLCMQRTLYLFVFKEKSGFVLMKSDFGNIDFYSVSFFITLVLT